MTSSTACLAHASAVLEQEADPARIASVLLDTYDALLALGDDAAAEGVADLVVRVEDDGLGLSSVLAALDTLR